MLDKKPVQVIFLFKFKMGHRQWRQLATSTTHLALEILTKTYTVVVVQEVLQRRREP